ncbi:MAG: hypothetical protein N2482_02560 [Patescibacteria group bacterium]|nr:hypothetical protein [Patescibacteria group bacterium]
MNSKTIIIIGAIILVAGLFFTSKKSPQKNNQKAENIVEKVEKTAGETGGIIVPKNIKRVTDEMRQKYQNQICQKESVAYCEYYTRLYKKTGEKRTKNLQWNSLCALIKNIGTKNSDLYEYKTLGYEEKPCY